MKLIGFPSGSHATADQENHSVFYLLLLLFPFNMLCCSFSGLSNVEKKKKLLKRLEEQLAKLNVQATDKEENKQIALGTSKLNYLDPRITIAW